MSRYLPLIVLSSLLHQVDALVWRDGVGRLPALGWSSWNAFEYDIDSTKILTAARKVVKLGLKDLGHENIDIDDCWSVKTHRDPYHQPHDPRPGQIPGRISNPWHAFESGHLQYYVTLTPILINGTYEAVSTGAGETAWAGHPASLGHEKIDAEAFADWGIDSISFPFLPIVQLLTKD